MDALTIMLLLGIAVVAIAIGTPIVLIALAAFIYAWTHMYPWLKMVGKWGARPANFVALLVFFMICFFTLIVFYSMEFLILPVNKRPL